MRKPQNFQWKEITMGTCYYPEHWSRELWQDDLQRMKAAGITAVSYTHLDVYKRQAIHSPRNPVRALTKTECSKQAKPSTTPSP